MIAVYAIASSYNFNPENLSNLQSLQLPDRRLKRVRALLPGSLQGDEVKFKTITMTAWERIQAIFVLIKDFFAAFISNYASLCFHERWEQIRDNAWVIAIKEEAPPPEEIPLKTPLRKPGISRMSVIEANKLGERNYAMPPVSHTPSVAVGASARRGFQSPIIKSPDYRLISHGSAIKAAVKSVKFHRAFSSERSPVTPYRIETPQRVRRGESEERKELMKGAFSLQFLVNPSFIVCNRLFVDFKAKVEKNKDREGFKQVASETLLAIMGLHFPRSVYLKETIEVLLFAGADVNVYDAHHRTLLQWAAERGKADIVELILSHPEIAVNAVDDKGKTVMHYAVDTIHADAKILDLLIERANPERYPIEKRIQLNALDKDEVDVFNLSIRAWRPDFLERLLKVNYKPGKRSTNQSLRLYFELLPYAKQVKERNEAFSKLRLERFKKIVSLLNSSSWNIFFLCEMEKGKNIIDAFSELDCHELVKIVQDITKI